MPRPQRIICEICSATLGERSSADRTGQLSLFILHAKAAHPEAYATMEAAADSARRDLPTKGLTL